MTTDKTPTALTAEERAKLREAALTLVEASTTLYPMAAVTVAVLDALDAAERNAKIKAFQVETQYEQTLHWMKEYERKAEDLDLERGHFESLKVRIAALEAELAAANAKLATREMQQDIAVNAAEAMTAAFERSQADLARVTDERDRAFRDGSKEPTRERDEHRAALNRIADRLRVVHEDPWIEAAVLELIKERDTRERELDATRETIARIDRDMRKIAAFARHAAECATEDSPINSGPCDCGLDAARKEAGL